MPQANLCRGLVNGQVALRSGRSQWKTSYGVWKPLAHMVMPKPIPHLMHLQQWTEEEMGLLQWRHNMCMRAGHRKYSSHATMFFLVTPLHIWWPYKVQGYRKGMCWTIEEKSLMTQWWLWLILGYFNFGYHFLLSIPFYHQPPPPTKKSFIRLWQQQHDGWCTLNSPRILVSRGARRCSNEDW